MAAEDQLHTLRKWQAKRKQGTLLRFAEDFDGTAVSCSPALNANGTNVFCCL